ncbi:translocation/assembly module TamB domain-containing protein [Bergeyella sp. RCAD1439]|uniref:translocation/assembly module TamB domain-containing protein n=1 Tax=Bergeyella anatis TaxID=3113737 RepID=UPI002E17C054|nr:translocation/assembly module TamB domain-containing protein [Bergeyella sp. RCAD1439]
MKVNARKILKYGAVALLSFVVLLVVLVLSLRLPAVQNAIKDRLVVYLEDKIQTKVELQRFYVGFPNSLVMENLYLQGKSEDTLLYAKKFDVGLDIPKLLSNTVDLTSIELEGIRANIVRHPDGRFNFDYILDAFATKEEEASESKPFVISLDKIRLKDIGISFVDRQAGNHTRVYFKHFDTRVKTFDLDKNSYALNTIAMDGLRLKLHQDLLEEAGKKVEEKVDSLNRKNPMNLSLGEIKLTDFNIDYGDENTKTFAKIVFGELSTRINGMDLPRNRYDIDRVMLKEAVIDARLHLVEKPSSDGEKKSMAEEENALQLLLGEMIIDNVRASYRNTAAKPATRGMDFNRLNFSNLHLDLRDFQMQEGAVTGEIRSARVKEGGGLDLRRLQTEFAYADRKAYLKKLYLETPYTVLRDEVTLTYDSVEQLVSNPGAVGVLASVRDSRVGFRDLLYFAPDLRHTSPFDKYPNAILNIDARLKGKINDLNISAFQVSGLGDLNVAVSGTVKNAMNPEKLRYDLNLRNISTSSATLRGLLPANTLPSTLTLPSKMVLSGRAKGSLSFVDTQLKLLSNLGNAVLDARVDMAEKGRELYTVKGRFQNFQLGTILQNKDLGMVSGRIFANGQNFDVMNGVSEVRGTLEAFDYNRYRYRNVALSAKVNRGQYWAKVNSDDPNANLNLTASGRYQNNRPTVALEGQIIKLDLHRLGFYQEPLLLAGSIDGAFSSLDPDALNGKLSLSHFALSNGKEVYPVQDIHITAEAQEYANRLSLRSQVADVDLDGNYKLTQIFGALQNTIHRYYRFQKTDGSTPIAPNQYFTFEAVLKDDDLLRRFVPELTRFEEIRLEGRYDADRQRLHFNGAVPSVTYADNTISGGSFNVANNDNALVYDLEIAKVETASMAVHRLALKGDVSDNTLRYTLSTEDEKQVRQFLVAGRLQSLGEGMKLSLNPDGLQLNYDHWKVAEDNAIHFGEKGFFAQNFTLSHDGSRIAVNSESQKFNSPLTVEVQNFRIETITDIIRKDSLLAQGGIDGTLRVEHFGKPLALTTNLDVTDLKVFGSPVGNLKVDVKTKTPEVLYADVVLSGFDNDVRINGDYLLADNAFDLQLKINRLQMKTLQGLSGNAIQKATGHLSGKINITGTANEPNLRGALGFNNAGLEITQTGSVFSDINDEIRFTGEGMVFDRFALNDNEGNRLVLDGKIHTKDYRDFRFDLGVNADGFRLVDSEEDNDRMMYGVLVLDAALHIGGDLALPEVDGRLAVTDKTDFTLVMPQSTPAKQTREGILEFVDKDKVALNQTLKTDSLDTQSRIKGMDVSVNIGLDKEAKFSLIIDKASGDFVKIQGEADLTGGIDPSGKTTLVGVFQVEKGDYEMSFSLVKRKFEIQKGSTITWTGEPTAANLDITAVYKTNAAPIDLVQQQITGRSSAEMNMYKQRIPFNTLLHLDGELLKPVITFDITTDDENPSVATFVMEDTKMKLEQLRTNENEMNKQVFALLMLNRFIGENPFQSESGVSAGTMARQSVSQILSQQLNNIASDLIAGVDLTFDFDSYEEYSTGSRNQRTDMNVALSKRLLDDRLKVSIGSSFGLEGGARQNENMTNIAGDIAVDYSLSKDGRYLLRAYRKNEYQVALQGQIIETGLSFVITLDYDDFKTIFRKSKLKTGLQKK